MSQQRTPLRSRSSLVNISNGVNTPLKQSTKARSSLSELKRPPSRSFRPSSPRISSSGSGSGSGSGSNLSSSSSSSSRPGSAMGNITGSTSRPSTPSFLKQQEPYTGTISVSIRPNPYSYNPSYGTPWEIDEEHNTIYNKNDCAELCFDNVFSPFAGLANRQVYHKSCSQIMHKFLHEGYNGTVFAYGMTGSGKTFSMRGNDQDPGIVRLAIDDIFRAIERESHTRKFTLSLNYIEIYNEKIVDLLNTETSNSIELKIRDDPVYGTKVVGIMSPEITSKNQLLQLLKKGDNNRRTCATDFNARSSRSHSILQIRMNSIDLVNKTEQNSTLSLCDLAGSERATSSLERRKEGSYINKSLLALSNVINKLSMSSGISSPNTIGEHIPYRDSKLTRILQPALSGSSLVLILCTIHLGSITTANNQQFILETYNTLRFAARAKDIVISVNKNKKSSLNEAVSSKLVEEMKRTIENQKNEIALLRMNSGSQSGGCDGDNVDMNARISQLTAENLVLYEKLEHLTRLNDLQKTETIMIRNEALNDLLGLNIENKALQAIMANLEEFHKRVNHEIDEYRFYINRLEEQLKEVYYTTHQRNEHDHNMGSPVNNMTRSQIEAVLKDQEEEIIHLKELLQDKQHIIRSLTKTTKLRKIIDESENLKRLGSGEQLGKELNGVV